MALFDRKRTNFDISTPYYTIGDSKTILVIGLGNPGKEYAANRHNAGFMALDYYQSKNDFSNWTLKKDLKCMISQGQLGSTKIILVKPTTFMNESGQAAIAVQKYFRLHNNDTIVVYDELDVDFATIRTRTGGGSAGHNGIKSLIAHINEDFGRIRVGIGPKKPKQIDSADFVLKDFTKKEQELIPKIVREVATFIDESTVGDLPEHTISLS